MRTAYLFIYDNNVGSRETIRGIIDSMLRVYTWRFDIPHSFYIISDYSAQDLYDEFVSKNGTKGRFMFVEASSNRQGQMLPDTWFLLTNNRHKPKQ